MTVNQFSQRLAMLAVAATLFPLFGQLDRGTITGTITDSSGAVIPGVHVTITQTAMGAAYQTRSSSGGQYSMPNLPAGPYQATFEASSFKKLVRSGITLGVTEVVRLDVSLEIGSLAESIQVAGETPRLQTDTPDVGTGLTSKQLVDLPLNFSGARIAENFAYSIAPGVTGGSYSSHINGSMTASKDSLLDGATVTGTRDGHFGESSVSVEAIEEFKVQTSGMSAEFGRAQGGIFNYVMKSGSNQIHGSAYASFHNAALDANTFSNNAAGLSRTVDRKNNYAASFGGPIIIPKVYDGHNRTFFYAVYERYSERTLGLGAPSRTVPLPEFYEGDFSRLLGPAIPQTDALGRQVLRGAIFDPDTFRQVSGGRWVGEMFPGNRIPVSRFSPISQKLDGMLQQHYLPTVRDASGQIPLINNATFPQSALPIIDQYNFSTKVDQIINDAQKISGSYAYNLRPRLTAQPQGAVSMWDNSDPHGGVLSKARLQRLQSQFVRVAHDWIISPHVLSHFQVFGNRLPNENANAQKGIDGAGVLGIKNLKTGGYPTINYGAGPFVPLATPGDPFNDYPVTTTWGAMESVSFSHGRHFMKAGFELRHYLGNDRPTAGGAINFAARATAIPNEAFSGNLTGYSFASYLLGVVDTASLSDPVGLGYRRHYYALYFQDDFKVNSHLTLQLGLRWDYQGPLREVANRLSNWNPATIDPHTGLPGAFDFAGSCSTCTGKNYFGKLDWNNIGPRVGFAWQPRLHWTVRGAYGIMYEGDPNNAQAPIGKAGYVAWGGTYQLSADPVQPWAGIFNWDNGFPTNKYTAAAYNAAWGDSNRPGMIDSNYGIMPYIQTWNFNIQRELGRGLVLDVGYLGNKATGLHAGELQVLNQLPVSALSQYGSKLNNAVGSAAAAQNNGVKYPFAGFNGTVAGALRPFPQVLANQTVNVYGAPLGFSTHNALQVTLNRQFSHGFTIYGNYVWSRTMANGQSALEADNGGRPLDYYNLKLEKSVADFDISHAVKLFMDYELPIGRGKALWGNAGRASTAILGGWSVSAILNYYSGLPLNFTGSFPLSGGWNGVTNRINIAPGPMLASGFDGGAFELSTLGSPHNTYLNKSVYSDAPPLTLGTAAYLYTQARSFPTLNEDLGLQKIVRFRERYRFQLRAEFLNLFNRHQLGGVVTAVTSPLFGQVTNVTGNRTIQIGARFDF